MSLNRFLTRQALTGFARLASIFLLLGTMAFSVAEAATVAKVKGRKLLIRLEGEPASKGDIYYLTDASGRRRAIIKIMAVKGDRAIAVLGKGRAQSGMGLQARTGRSGNRPSARSASRSSGDSGGSMASGKAYWGLMLGYSMDNMDVDLAKDEPETVSLSGSAMNYKALVDYALFSKVWFRGTVGMENFAGEGPQRCGKTNNLVCDVNISYISFDFWGRYVFTSGTFRPWIGAGFSLLFPMSKESTALDESSITNTSIMSLGGGFDMSISPNFYIPLQVEYGLLPTSDQVSANLIAIRVGAAFQF